MERIGEPVNLLKNIHNTASLEGANIYDRDQNQEKHSFPEHSDDSDTQRRLHELYGADVLGKKKFIVKINCQ